MMAMAKIPPMAMPARAPGDSPWPPMLAGTGEEVEVEGEIRGVVVIPAIIGGNVTGVVDSVISEGGSKVVVREGAGLEMETETETEIGGGVEVAPEYVETPLLTSQKSAVSGTCPATTTVLQFGNCVDVLAASVHPRQST